MMGVRWRTKSKPTYDGQCLVEYENPFGYVGTAIVTCTKDGEFGLFTPSYTVLRWKPMPEKSDA